MEKAFKITDFTKRKQRLAKIMCLFVITYQVHVSVHLLEHINYSTWEKSDWETHNKRDGLPNETLTWKTREE